MFFIIIAIIAVIGGFCASTMFEKESNKLIRFIGIGLGIVLTLIGCIKTVPTGHTGVVTLFGQVQNYTYEAGIHFCNPFVKVIKMDNRTQRAQAELSCFSSDIQEVSVIYTVNYQIDKKNAQTIYRNIGQNYFEIVVEPKMQECVKGVTARYTAESLIEKRTTLSKEIRG